MPINFRISALVPVGLIVESVAQLDDSILVTARAGVQAASCPLCGSPSRRVHSRYVSEVSDLPCSGRSVRLRVVIRRYRCDTQHCRRQIFAERLDKTVLLVRSRRTSRLDCIVHQLALGGRPAASFAKRLMLPVSNDTVLRVVRARACPRTEPLNVVGIDDWAFRRNHSYGTIVCDLERRRIDALDLAKASPVLHSLSFSYHLPREKRPLKKSKAIFGTIRPKSADELAFALQIKRPTQRLRSESPGWSEGRGPERSQ